MDKRLSVSISCVDECCSELDKYSDSDLDKYSDSDSVSVSVSVVVALFIIDCVLFVLEVWVELFVLLLLFSSLLINL